VAVAVAELATRWRPQLEKALEHGGSTHSVYDVLTGLEEGRFIPVLGEESFCVVEVLDFPRERHIFVWLAGGVLSEIEDKLLPRIERFGEAVGATKLTAVARRGWARAGKSRYGWHSPRSYFEKELGDGREDNERHDEPQQFHDQYVH
jgi:hypothetical protein